MSNYRATYQDRTWWSTEHRLPKVIYFSQVTVQDQALRTSINGIPVGGPTVNSASALRR